MNPSIKTVILTRSIATEQGHGPRSGACRSDGVMGALAPQGWSGGVCAAGGGIGLVGVVELMLMLLS